MHKWAEAEILISLIQQTKTETLYCPRTRNKHNMQDWNGKGSKGRLAQGQLLNLPRPKQAGTGPFIFKLQEQQGLQAKTL